MPALQEKIRTVVLLMFENRSFDHMLGHLSLEGLNPAVRGLKLPLQQDAFRNVYGGGSFYPFPLPNDSSLQADIPHEYPDIAVQLGRSGVTGRYTMRGFVESYARKTGQTPNPECDPMGFFSSAQVPVTSFLARTFCTCDNWFASLPGSTQPNRTMAFTGDSPIHATQLQLIKTPDTIFHWMDRNGIRWRVYHDGLPFFVFYPSLWKWIFSDHFRDYERLYHDLQQPPAPDDPQVIIIEPSYADAPHIGPDHPNDNHPPLAIGWGEDFLRTSYQAVTANSERWQHTALVVYYDEHGGFYDHVPPPPVSYATQSDTPFLFDSLGVRIPAVIASPWVEAGSVSHTLYDHTSVLRFLAELFTPGVPYSESVRKRSLQAPGIGSLSAAFTGGTPLAAPLAPSQPIVVKSALGGNLVLPDGTMQQSFELAAGSLMAAMPRETGARFPELTQWKDTVQKVRRG